MDKPILELLEEVSGADLLFTLILIVGIVALLLTQKKRIAGILNQWRTDKNEEEDFQSLVYSLKNSIEVLSSEVKQEQERRESAMARYGEEIHKQSEAIAGLTKTVLEIQEKNSETKRAEIKEKIERIYRECTTEQICTEMQFESLKDLIDQYEKHGGDNSFVHSIVQKEMYSWLVVKENRRVSRLEALEQMLQEVRSEKEPKGNS